MLRRIRRTALALAGVAVIAGSSIAAVAEAAPDSGSAAPGCFAVPVTPILTWGWGPLDGEAPGQIVAGPGARGSGFLDLSGPPRHNMFHLAGVPLRPLAVLPGAIGFRHHGRYVSYQIRLRGADRIDNNASGFTTLVWEPSWNGDSGEGSWENSRNLGPQRWWSTQAINGLPDRNQTMTLSQISARNPLAVVTSYGVQGDGTPAQADDVSFGCARWDFEPGFGS